MQCKAAESITPEVKMRGKRLNVSPKFIYLFPNYESRKVLISSVPKGKTKWYFVSMMGSFTVTFCCRGFGNHVAVPLCLCAGKGNCSRNRTTTEFKEKSRMAGLGILIRREREREQVKSSKNYTIWNIYNVIIYDLLIMRWQLSSCFLLDSYEGFKEKKKKDIMVCEEVRINIYGFTPITAMAIIYICSIYCCNHRFYI